MRPLTFLLAALAIAVVAASPVHAELLRLTIYDDGLSCPANCDAHVVFHLSLNGTEFAHSPSTPEATFAKCDVGKNCRICLESGGKQCIEVVYRGGGPPPKTLDFTPAFYSDACASTPEQPHLAAKCKELKKAARSLEGRVNCIAAPEHHLCQDIMSAASESRAEDWVKYEECLAKGEALYNKNKPIAEQRSLRCAYEMKGTGGPNSKGTTWRRLLPGACREGTFVGRDGLDCCSGNTFADGPLNVECRAFYPKEPAP